MNGKEDNSDLIRRIQRDDMKHLLTLVMMSHSNHPVMRNLFNLCRRRHRSSHPPAALMSYKKQNLFFIVVVVAVSTMVQSRI